MKRLRDALSRGPLRVESLPRPTPPVRDPPNEMNEHSRNARVTGPPLPAAAGERLGWRGLHGAAVGLAIAAAARRHPGPLLVMTPDTPAAERLEAELRFFLAAEGPAVSRFPEWETLPYDAFSPHQSICSERLAALARLARWRRGVLIAAVPALLAPVPPPTFIAAHTFVLEVGERLDREALCARLIGAGYRRVGQVYEHGELAIRGSLLDCFPMGAAAPYRIDLLDDEVESIRRFDPESQRSEARVERLEVLPAREFPLDEAAIARFRQAWRGRFEGDPTRCPVYREVSQGLAPPGIEYFLPLFHGERSTLLDHLPAPTLVIECAGVGEAAERFWAEACARHEERRHDLERPILAPGELFAQPGELNARAASHPRVRIRGVGSSPRGAVDFATEAPVAVPIEPRATDPLAALRAFLERFPGRVLLVAESAGRRETLRELLAGRGLKATACRGWAEFSAGEARLALTEAPLEDGMTLREPPLALLAERQLFGERAAARRRRRAGRDAESIIRDLGELADGAPVVHEDHGVGRYRGLVTLEVDGVANEYLRIDYAGDDRLYVPVASLHLVSRYTGAEPEQAPLHRLGSGQWARARKRAAERVHDVAAELLEIQARRAARPGHRHPCDPALLEAFAAGFPFEPTPDQQASIDAVIADLGSAQPMDRVVCGDVGFGKTEVALRAAFVVVQGGSQVAVLVPTTLLAQQHYQTFLDRFADWPVRIELLSRFRSREEREGVLAGLAAGRVDIVIGTHKLLQDDVRFARLGLVVIDEEHRFGVRQKERLKRLRAETDVLTLTATPIPRTLNMALSGLRDLSLIATAPERRLSIRTFVRQWDNALVREACLRELHRGGQVYVVHNKVQTIERLARRIRELVPEATVAVAHGQMRERELERVMLDFYHRRCNVLVCTTIIETGIDVPTANTMIIDRADRFGLAQLHQLRGRVGRSHHRAYAYLVAPDRRAMSADAIKRLEAIESLGELGIGFTLATHDLEIRGAGELLGEEQSGQIQEVGYSLYTRMLERAVAALKAGRAPQLDRPLDHGAEIDLQAPARIPEDYLPDVHQRLILYKRIASAAGDEALAALREEMIDRFGVLPEATRTLFRVTALKLKATPLGVRKATLGARGGRIRFGPQPNVDTGALVRLVQGEGGAYRLEGETLRIAVPSPTIEARVALLADLFDALATREAA